MAKRAKGRSKPRRAPEAGELDLGPLRLNLWLEAAQVSKAWLARETGVGPSYITQLCDPEGYPNKEPRFSALTAIARALSRKLGYRIVAEELYEAPPSPRDIARARNMAGRMAAFDK